MIKFITNKKEKFLLVNISEKEKLIEFLSKHFQIVEGKIDGIEIKEGCDYVIQLNPNKKLYLFNEIAVSLIDTNTIDEELEESIFIVNELHKKRKLHIFLIYIILLIILPLNFSHFDNNLNLVVPILLWISCLWFINRKLIFLKKNLHSYIEYKNSMSKFKINNQKYDD